MAKNLLNAITATAATKVPFTLTAKDFKDGFPSIKSRGLGTDDTISIWEWVNGDWQDTGVTLDESTTSRLAESPGKYAVTASLTTSGPVSVDLSTAADP